MIRLSEKNLIKTLWRTTHDQNHHKLPRQHFFLSLWGSPWVVHGAVLQLRCWYHSDGHTVRAKNSLTKIPTSLMWGHTQRETQTLPHSSHRSCSVCVEERVWRVVRAGDRAGHQSETISEPEREVQIKLMQCQRLGVKRAGRRPALSFQALGTLAQAEQAAALAPGQGRTRRKTPG